MRDAPIGAIYEWRADNLPLALGRRLVRQGGAALVIDYGHVESAPGDTLQAVGGHAFVNPLQSPGEVDLTAHVDFQAFALAAESMGARVHGPIEQARVPPQPRHREARRHAQGAGHAREGRRDRRRGQAAARRRPHRDGHAVQGDRHRRSGARQPAGLRARAAVAADRTPCCKRNRCPGFPASATASSPAPAASRTASTKASTAASAPRTRPPRSPRTAPAWRQRSASRRSAFSPATRSIRRTVVVAETPWPASDRPRADAIVTRVPGFAIGISTADCGPVLLADAEARVIGAAHAGWRGALTGVIEATVAAMEKLGAERARIVAAAGPMIRQPNYEVGQDLVDRFVAVEPNTRPLLQAGEASRPCDVRSRRLCRLAAAAGRDRGRSRTSGCAPMPTRRSSIPTAAPPTGRSPITAGISTRSRWPINDVRQPSTDSRARRPDGPRPEIRLPIRYANSPLVNKRRRDAGVR